MGFSEGNEGSRGVEHMSVDSVESVHRNLTLNGADPVVADPLISIQSKLVQKKNSRESSQR